jgi:hypothetical protein
MMPSSDTFGKNSGERNAYRIFTGKPPFRDRRIDGRIILKWGSKEIG